jgi:hypothetical protein
MLRACALRSLFSTTEFLFCVTSNLDRGYEKRTMDSCAFASQNYSAPAPRPGLLPGPAKSLFQNTLRVSYSLTIPCRQRFGGWAPKRIYLQDFADLDQKNPFACHVV